MVLKTSNKRWVTIIVLLVFFYLGVSPVVNSESQNNNNSIAEIAEGANPGDVSGEIDTKYDANTTNSINGGFRTTY